jgi:phosphopantothenoylcysteine synthetase/decarboxylase
VRKIVNDSSGTFGSRIAAEALEQNHEVIYLAAEKCKTPFSTTFDFNQTRDWEKEIGRFAQLYNFCEKHRKHYSEWRYQTFEEYWRALERLIKDQKPDAVILAAAVSDYLVENPVDGKIRSGADKNIPLKDAPKIISMVKEWQSEMVLVGFKFLVGSTEEELIDEAKKSIEKNGCAFVVANDATTLHSGRHEIVIVEPSPNGYKHQRYKKELEKAILQRLVKKEQPCTTSSSE